MTESPERPLSPPDGGGSARVPDPVAVFLLNLFLFGAAGYYLLRQREKAVLAAIVWVALAWPTCFSASLAIAAITAIDGYLQAKLAAEGHAIGKWTMFGNTR
jgi:hypothetical protein